MAGEGLSPFFNELLIRKWEQTFDQLQEVGQDDIWGNASGAGVIGPESEAPRVSGEKGGSHPERGGGRDIVEHVVPHIQNFIRTDRTTCEFTAGQPKKLIARFPVPMLVGEKLQLPIKT